MVYRFIFLVFVAFCAIAHASTIYRHNKAYLDRLPDCFWNPEKTVFLWGVGENPQMEKGGFHPKGSAGIIPYILYEQKTYVLVSRETWGADKRTYCDLGGAIEAPSDTFLATLLKEGREESAYLYAFEEDDVLNTAHIFSYVYRGDGFYNGFESVFAFCEVKDLYFTEHFIGAAVPYIQDLKRQNLCPWGFQEKDDYQWIGMRELYSFLKESDAGAHVFKNFFSEDVEIWFRSHFIEALRSDAGMNLLLSILEREQAFTRVDETSL